jgi:hypothetical protein
MALAPPAPAQDHPAPAQAHPAPAQERPAQAQEHPAPTARPDMSRRVVRVFDFEEALTNPLAVPLNWFRLQDNPDSAAASTGFSTFNRAELDFATAYRGQGSVRLPTLGGSTRLRLATGVLPVFANADYLVSARIRTTDLRHARASLVARFLDQAGAPITASELRSEPVVSADQWLPVSILLTGDHHQAAFIQIDLDLLQPAQAAPSARSAHEVRAEDSTGDAWFDDVAVIQLPRIQLSTTAPANTVIRPEAPELSIFVRDLTGESLRGRIIVQDATGQEAARWESAISAGRMSARWSPPLTRLGWYRATLEVVGGDRRVGAAFVDFVWLPEAGPAGERSPDRPRFGVVIQTLEPGQRPAIPELIRRSGAGAVTLPAWAAGLTAANADHYVAELKPVVDGLLAQWQSLTFSLDTVPAELVKQFPAAEGDPLAVLANPEETWSPLLYPLLDKYGQSVRRWQLGHLGDELTFRDRALGARLDRADRVISRLVPGPRLVVPWRADRALTSDVLGPRRDDLDVLVPYAMPADAIAEYAAALRDDLADAGGPGRAGLIFESLPPEQFGPSASAADLIKRAVEFWSVLGADEPGGSSGSARIAIVQPWDWVGQRRPQLMPRADLAVWRTLSDRLSDRRIRGRFPLAPGVVAYLLAPGAGAPEGRGGALVAWRESAAPAESRLELFLGAGEVTAIDPFGNAAVVPLRPATIDAAGVPVAPVHTLALGDDPVFIEGVDVELLNFLTGIRVEPAFLSSDSLQHDCELILTNPWTLGASGRVYIVQPGGFTERGTLDKSWTLTPRTQDFTIPAGETIRLPLTIAFSPAQEAGVQHLVLDLDVAASREYSRVRFTTPFEVGLDEMRLDIGYRLEGAGDAATVIVEARITNQTQQPLTLEITGFAPGFPRQAASVGRLPPGEHAVRQFAFPGGLSRLRSESVSITVENIETRAKLNKFVTIE